jgi:hypothetical protein
MAMGAPDPRYGQSRGLEGVQIAIADMEESYVLFPTKTEIML